MASDGELLRRYTDTASEEAFGELVRRHLDLVYSAALRQVNGDAHLAKDVAQSVFTDLARKAGSLTERAGLAAWLYTSTHHAAAKAVRAARRRQTREQEAHTMQELLRDPGPNLDWETFRPVLDAAMHELSEPDREAILLRYFQNRPYADIGAQLGVGENAARMRVERALEKLRTALSRRGVATTATLATALSAHAVGTAPAGLAGTITTVATLAGTTAAGTAAATTTAILMTTLQKTLIAAALAAAVGTGIYESIQSSHSREQNEVLRQQQASLAAQIADLQRQRDAATNRLLALAGENERLRSARNSDELLQLRGKVGVLQNALAGAAATNQPGTSLLQIMRDPAFKDLIRQKLASNTKAQYAPLFKELNLSPEQTAAFIQLIVDKNDRHTEILEAANGVEGPAEIQKTKAVDDDIQSQQQALLGEAGFARLKAFNEEFPGHTVVKQMNEQLGDNALNADQSARLFQLVKAQPTELTLPLAGSSGNDLFGSPQDNADYLQRMAESNQRILDQAAGFLTPPQLTALAGMASNSLSLQKMAAALVAPGH